MAFIETDRGSGSAVAAPPPPPPPPWHPSREGNAEEPASPFLSNATFLPPTAAAGGGDIAPWRLSPSRGRGPDAAGTSGSLSASLTRNPPEAALARFNSGSFSMSTVSNARAAATIVAQANDAIQRALRFCDDPHITRQFAQQQQQQQQQHVEASNAGGGGNTGPAGDAPPSRSPEPSPGRPPRPPPATTSVQQTGPASMSVVSTSAGTRRSSTASSGFATTRSAMAYELANALARSALPGVEVDALTRVADAFQPFVSVALAAAAGGSTGSQVAGGARKPNTMMADGFGMSESTLAASVRSLHRDPAQLTATAAVAEHEDACEDGFTVNQYLLLDKIGAGKQGEVFLAEDTTTGAARAVKVVRRPPAARARGGALAAARSRQAQQLEREVAVMRQCRHRNVVALHEVIDDPKHDTMYLVMQYVDAGPIATIGPDGTCSATLGVVELTHFARQLCAGLQYLHGHGVIHRDIKPDNILRGRDGTVYLSDFGVSELFDPKPASNSSGSEPSSSRQHWSPLGGGSDANNADSDMERSTVHGTRGTVAFMAPELFSATETQGTPGEAVDVWALGVTFYALLYGRLPFVVDGSSSMASLVASIRAFHLDIATDSPSGRGGGASTVHPTSFMTMDVGSLLFSTNSRGGDGVWTSAGASTTAGRRISSEEDAPLDGGDDAPAAVTHPTEVTLAAADANITPMITLLPPPPTSTAAMPESSMRDSTRRTSTGTAHPGADSIRGGGGGPPTRRESDTTDVGTPLSDATTNRASLTSRQDELHAEWRQLLHEMLCADPVRRIQTGQLRRRVRAMSERLSGGDLEASVWPCSPASASKIGRRSAGMQHSGDHEKTCNGISDRWQSQHVPT